MKAKILFIICFIFLGTAVNAKQIEPNCNDIKVIVESIKKEKGHIMSRTKEGKEHATMNTILLYELMGVSKLESDVHNWATSNGCYLDV